MAVRGPAHHCGCNDRLKKTVFLLRRTWSPFWQILLQKDFWSWNEEQFSRIKTELGILIHRAGYSDSIIAQFPRSGGLMGTFATVSDSFRTSGTGLQTVKKCYCNKFEEKKTYYQYSPLSMALTYRWRSRPQDQLRANAPRQADTLVLCGQCR